MFIYDQARFPGAVLQIMQDFGDKAEKVDVGQWQGLDVRGDSQKVTWELREAVLRVGMPDSIEGAQRLIQPNLPWAEDHFNERVDGQPLNPPPSHRWWPFAQNGHAEHLKVGMFSHTYPKRFWPKHAGHAEGNCPRENGWDGREGFPCDWGNRKGIRFSYGDYRDVVERLVDNPMTRQAYLPVWFPEDTGAPKGERVPCTLGYLFLVRNGKLHLTYHIRSCDFMRHFRDDVYMGIRLAQHTVELMNYDRTARDLEPFGVGELTMHIGSFHIFEGDRQMLQHQLAWLRGAENSRLLEGLS